MFIKGFILSKNFPILIDFEAQSQTFKWWSTDLENVYRKNLKSDWEYENSEDLVYNFNEWGYRTKNIDNLDKDFILVFGCSYTEGVGLYQKDIWCEKLCKELDIDIFNLAKQGSGSDISYMNTILYVKNLIKYKPRLVIYQWPQAFRRTFAHYYLKPDFQHDFKHIVGNKVVRYRRYEPTEPVLRMINFNVNTDTSNKDSRWYKKRWLREQGEMYKDSFFNFYSADVLWKALDVPVYHWTWSGDFEKGGENSLPFFGNEVRIINNKSNDTARDLMHDGKQIHSDVKDFLIDDIRKLL